MVGAVVGATVCSGEGVAVFAVGETVIDPVEMVVGGAVEVAEGGTEPGTVGLCDGAANIWIIS